MTFRETLRTILRGTSYEFRLGDPHIHLNSVLEIVQAKKNRNYPEVASDHDDIRDIPNEFGLMENVGLTPLSLLYQNVAHILQEVAPNAIQDVDEDGTVRIDEAVEFSPAANMNKLTSAGRDVVCAMLYIDGIGYLIRSIDSKNNYVEMYDVECGLKSLIQAQELLPNEKSVNEAASLGEQIKQAASVEEKKSWCFIATAVYGDILAPEVVCLRQYRDTVLNITKTGRSFVEFYYFISPSLARVVSKSGLLKWVIRKAILDPFVSLLRRGIIQTYKNNMEVLMAQEKIKCGKCGTDNWVDPFKTTACKKCGAPIKGTKAK